MKAKKKSAGLLMAVAMVVAVLLAVFVPTVARAEEADSGETSASVTFEKGKLELQAVPTFGFGVHILDSSVNSFAATSDSVIRVSDARGTGEGWSLVVSLSPFRLGDEETLQGAKIEIEDGEVSAYGGTVGTAPSLVEDENGRIVIVSNGQQTKVLQAQKGQGTGIWQATLPAESTQLVVNPGTAEEGSSLATMNWSLQNAP